MTKEELKKDIIKLMEENQLTQADLSEAQNKLKELIPRIRMC